MTDNQGWQPPASPVAGIAPAGSASPWATPVTAPPVAAPVPAWQQQQATPGWTAPPKPGLIPLHPLGFGTIIGSSFRVMRRNPAPTFGLSILLYGFITIVYVGVFAALFALLFSRLSTATSTDQGDIAAGGAGLIALSTLIPTSLALIATAVLQGIISLEVSRATLGEKLKIRGLWRLAKGRLGTMVLWALLLTACLVVYVAISSIATFLVFAAGAASSSSTDAIGAVIGGMLLTLLLGLAFGVVGAWLGIKTALVPSIIMLERLTLRASIRRSWQLTRGHFWRTLGAQLLIGVIVYAASSVVSIPISLFGSIVLGVTNPTENPETYVISAIVTLLLGGMVTVVVGAIGLVMQSASLALIYIDIRMRNEGLDLELLRYVESKHAGTLGVENPYLRLQGAAAAPPETATGSPWA